MITFHSAAAPARQWPSFPAPRINIQIPPVAVRAAMASLRAVDRDIEREGAVSWETVEQVRATRALIRSLSGS